MQRVWLGLFYASYFAFVGLYSPFLGPYLKDLGHSLDVIAMALGLMQLMRVIGPFGWGWLCDQTGGRVRWIRLGAMGGLLFSMLAFHNDSSALHVLIMLVFLNLCISGLVPMSDAFAIDACNGCSGQYGKVRLFGSIGFIVSVLGFGTFAQWSGFDSYPVWVCVTLLLTWLAALAFRDPETKGSPEIQVNTSVDLLGLKSLIQPRALQLFWLAAFFMIFAHGVFYAYFSLYLLEYDYTKSVIGGFWAFGVFCEVMFFAFQARFFNCLSLNSWLCVAFASCAVRFVLLGLFPDLLWVVVFSQSMHSLTFAAHHSATIAWLRENLSSHLLVRGQAMYATIAYGLGGSSGTLLGRYVWQLASPHAAFLMAAGAGVLALLFGLLLCKMQQSSTPALK